MPLIDLGRTMSGGHVRRSSPAGNRDLFDFAPFDHVGEDRASFRNVEPEVVSDVMKRPDAVVRGRRTQQSPVGLLLPERVRQVPLLRDHSLWHVIEPGEVPGPPGSDLALGEQHLKTDLPWSVSPPCFVAMIRSIEVPYRQRPVFVDLTPYVVDQLRVRLEQCLRTPPDPHLAHPPPPERIPVDGEHGRLVCPVLEVLATFVQPDIQGCLVICPESRIERHVVRAHTDVHAIELDQAEPIHHPSKVTDIHHSLRFGV